MTLRDLPRRLLASSCGMGDERMTLLPPISAWLSGGCPLQRIVSGPRSQPLFRIAEPSRVLPGGAESAPREAWVMYRGFGGLLAARDLEKGAV